MKRKYSIVAGLLLAALFFMGYQCSSTEITSARLYIQQENWDKALESLNKEVEKNPQSAEGYYLLGYVYGEKEQYDKMMDAFEKSLNISSKFKSDIVSQKNFHWAENFNNGVRLYNRASSTADPDSMEMFFEASIDRFDSAMRIYPDSTDAHKNVAFVYLSLNVPDKAIEPLQKLVEIEKAADGYRYLGEIYYNKGLEYQNEYKSTGNKEDSIAAVEQFNKAIDILEEGRKEHPGNQEMLLFLSNAYINANKIDVAIDAFKSGVENDPENKFYRYNYGVLLLGAKDYESAETQFKKALELDPDYLNALYNLAVTYVKWGAALQKIADEEGVDNPQVKENYQKALPLLERYVEKKEDEAFVWETLGQVYSILGMIEEAEDAFAKADQYR